MWIVAVYGLMSIVTFAAYGIDKRRARRGQWRIRERTLHVLALCCGWPGALAGQALFRHKRQKLGFMVVFGVIVAVHVLFWIVLYQRH